MSEETGKLEQVLEELKRMRDELALKIHLGKADAKDEWAKLEKKWDEVQAKLHPVKQAAGETARNVGSALELAAEELKAGYERFRKLV